MSVPLHAHGSLSNRRILLLVVPLSVQISINDQEIQQSFSVCNAGPTPHEPNSLSWSLQVLAQLMFAVLQRWLYPL